MAAQDFGAELLRRQLIGAWIVHARTAIAAPAAFLARRLTRSRAPLTLPPPRAPCRLGAELSRNPPEGISVGLGEDENIFSWDCMIVGPPDTL